MHILLLLKHNLLFGIFLGYPINKYVKRGWERQQMNSPANWYWQLNSNSLRWRWLCWFIYFSEGDIFLCLVCVFLGGWRFLFIFSVGSVPFFWFSFSSVGGVIYFILILFGRCRWFLLSYFFGWQIPLFSFFFDRWRCGWRVFLFNFLSFIYSFFSFSFSARIPIQASPFSCKQDFTNCRK